MELAELETKVKRFYEAHRRAVLFALALCFAIFMAADHTYFHGRIQSAVNILALIEVVLIIAFMTLVAGVVVIRALFDVSIGLSLIIFLSQAYCSSPIHTPDGSGALRTLIIFGLGYVAYDFATKLYKGLRDFFKSMDTLKWDIGKIVISAVFITMAIVFVWSVYAVMSPIVLGFCVYQ